MKTSLLENKLTKFRFTKNPKLNVGNPKLLTYEELSFELRNAWEYS